KATSMHASTGRFRPGSHARPIPSSSKKPNCLNLARDGSFLSFNDWRPNITHYWDHCSFSPLKSIMLRTASSLVDSATEWQESFLPLMEKLRKTDDDGTTL
ncbi:unnamed protein product, partial [Dovyalis caffra]